MHWLSKAWRNTSSITPADRIVFLKTGFEALTDSGKSHVSAERLRLLFEDVLGSANISSDDEILWSPNDQSNMTRTWGDQGHTQTAAVTPLEHWFMSFVDSRNAVIHRGRRTAGQYSEGTAFDGSYVWTGEWLLRVAIKLRLHQLGHRNHWRSQASREMSRLTKRLINELEASDAQ
jgi:hypothetical protein